MKDFLVGDINELSSSRLVRAISGGREGYSISQLDRLFKIKPVLDVHDGTSHPDFGDFLEAVDPKNIQKVEIITHEYHVECVGDVYGANIYFENGIIRYLPHWTAYKEIRAEEIITTMLTPLKLAGLGDFISIVDEPYNVMKMDFFTDVGICASHLERLFSMTEHSGLYDHVWYKQQADYLLSLETR
ncbi:hypothetical protein [Vibrio anguillarum]|uniref:hypothetical protein n=1 Tax=Vibrio anguillarum TaxID=55601 RepID=UPI0016B4E9BB|nr:hypothetical protein [Vibrio anguillarum]NOI06669.1 hypothetical protein [Vibrio anguillarum]